VGRTMTTFFSFTTSLSLLLLLPPSLLWSAIP
jgi:hypothetical protein